MRPGIRPFPRAVPDRPPTRPPAVTRTLSPAATRRKSLADPRADGTERSFLVTGVRYRRRVGRSGKPLLEYTGVRAHNRTLISRKLRNVPAEPRPVRSTVVVVVVFADARACTRVDCRERGARFRPERCWAGSKNACDDVDSPTRR